MLPLSLYMPQLRSWHHTGTDKYSHYTRTYPISEFDVVAISSPPAPSHRLLVGLGVQPRLDPAPEQLSDPRLPPVWIRHSHQFTIMRMVARTR